MKVGPDFLRPKTNAPEAWLEAEYAASRPGQPVDATWWTPAQ